jgi:hypothetical protein
MFEPGICIVIGHSLAGLRMTQYFFRFFKKNLSIKNGFFPTPVFCGR